MHLNINNIKKLSPDSSRYQGFKWRTERPVTGSDYTNVLPHMRILVTRVVTVRRTITVRTPVRIVVKRIG